MSGLFPFVEIELAAVVANFNAIAAATPGATPAAVVKCDAYGLGLAPVSRALALKAGCRDFFVAYAATGVALRAALADVAPAPAIYVFNGPAGDDVEAYHEARLNPVLNTIEQAAIWAERGDGRDCVLHVDTGMNRLGLSVEDLPGVKGLPGLNVSIVMSHFASASTPGASSLDVQHERFLAAARIFPAARRSLSSTGGALQTPRYGFDLVRLGVGVYGVGPFGAPHPDLRTVARLLAPVLQLRRARAGETVGYDETHRLARESLLATVALGYGDGYPRAASNRGAAWLAGAARPILGRVSMDLIVLDATDAAERPAVGALAEFFGPSLPIETAAASCDAIGYELLTGLGPRVVRRYLWEGALAEPALLSPEGRC